jgi:creatinine amidohydrolase/Fe(II)-dependent formamide hydrolase-like protein
MGKTGLRRALAVALLAVAAGGAMVQRPLTAPLSSSIQIADMTWLEVREAVGHGYSTVLVPSGGLEQNGVHMPIGKHDHVVRYAAERIARDLGRTLVAPVVSFVPQGRFDPPEGHLRYPGTIGVSDEAFAGTLEGIARSLRLAGFKTICFLADHGASTRVQAEVARRLNAEWGAAGPRVIDVSDYYSSTDAQIRQLRQEGETDAAIGYHAGILDTSELMAVRPEAVDLSRLQGAALRLEPTGASGDPARSSPERGRALLGLRIDAAIRQIRAEGGAGL